MAPVCNGKSALRRIQAVKAIKPWKLLETSHLTSVEPWFQIFREKVALPSGRVLDDFYRIVTPEFAMVVPITSAGELLMVRGYKHGPRKVCLSAPGGMIEAGESPLKAAQRELLEETGHEASQWLSLGEFTVDSNRQGGTAHIFMARDLRQIASRKQDDAEELQVELLPPGDFSEAIRKGEIVTLATVAAVALAMLNLTK
jgi:ADP-ribose pyrophosphatase